MESLKNIKKGLEIAFGMFLFSGIIFGVVYAVGFHNANEIIDGAFEGSYDFTGDVNFTSASVSGLDMSAGIPIGFVGSFYLSSCPGGWKAADGTSGTPDLRGQFLRGINDFGTGARVDGNQDPDARALGSFQTDLNAEHLHSVDPPSTVTSSDGNHQHSLNGMKSGTNDNYAYFSGETPSKTIWTNAAGVHTHTLDILAFDSANSGGVESRPNNVGLIYCVKE